MSNSKFNAFARQMHELTVKSLCLIRGLMFKRKSTTFRLDERIIKAMDKAAKQANASKNRYIENIFLKHCQALGILPMDFEPLGETRGGDRTKKEEE